MSSSVDDYLATSNMRSSGVWGTDIEIFAAASLFSVDIYVYSQFGNNYKWSKCSQSMLDRLPLSSNMGIYLNNVNVLPRSMDELQTIPVKLKRHLGYKHHYTFQSIRPLKVLKAAQYLGKNSKLFINEGIQVNDSSSYLHK